MGHLVKSLPLDAEKRLTPSECLDLLAEAHDYLARQGASVVEEVLAKQNLRSWGSDLEADQSAAPPGWTTMVHFMRWRRGSQLYRGDQSMCDDGAASGRRGLGHDA